MKKLYSLVIETVDAETSEFVSRKVMGASHSIEKLKEYFFQVNSKFNINDDWKSNEDESSYITIYDEYVITFISIEEINFIQ
jgi:hypothetical protein